MRTGWRTRRVGVLYLLLSIGGMAGALGMAVRFDLRVAETVAALLPSLGGMYLSWATFGADRREAAEGFGVAGVADRLAVAVRRQWESEARVRRLNDPYPLPVSWQAADARFGESWSLLREMARHWPDGRSAPRSAEVTESAGLAGTGGEIAEVFLERVPTRRLVVLGGPGSGKTMLLIRLLLALVAERAEGGSVPVLFPLASWNPAEQTLESWMAEQLARDYSGLGDPGTGPADRTGRVSHARALLEHRLILPILDGFDEIPAPYRAVALDAINAALPPGQPLVLSSRVTEYGDTLSPAHGVPVKLSGAAAVELHPLRAPDIADYLERDAGGQDAAAARWEPVIRLLGTDAPVARALTTPLMLFLARTVYNPRPEERAGVLPKPADLCDPTRFPDAAAVRAHLFDAYVPAAYRPHPRYPCRWSPQQAERALRYLARHLQHTLGGTTDLVWWQLRRALPSRVAQVVTGTVLGVVAWAAATVVGRLTALLAGLDSGWLTGPPAAIVAGLAGGIAGGIGCGLVAGVTGGIAEGLTHVFTTGQPEWLATTTANGLAYGFAGGIVGALSSRLAVRQPGTASGHRQGWAWDWRMCALGFTTGATLWFPYRLNYGPMAAAVGALANGTVYALAGGATGARASSLSAHRPRAIPTVRTRWAWDWRGFSTGLASGSGIGVTHWAVLRIQSLLTGMPSYTIATMLSFSCAIGLAVGIAHGLTGKPADLATSVGPVALLEQDRRIFRRLWIVVGLAIGAAFLLCYGLEYGAQGGLSYGLGRGTTDGQAISMGPPHILDRSLAYGLTVGLAAALSHNAWWCYTLTRHHLATRRQLPRDLTAFLIDAHERRGVLRQVGAVHQFRHIDLQHHLAAAGPSQESGDPLPRLPRPRIPLSPTRRR
ncbi:MULTISPECIES: NACHT domain-containing protein [unclassified Streptomyces]|uniref:NACHT domain-containing protein n=1 Tax=unclassified Streptomyces TaxID=2593676 RepID=UPI002E81D931|nr:NACHT domain-containing protein [Streptomyces sp. NBC_00589]WTI34109.1 NACHT domain-containing protein [Streptomyces sp. NBC_00775]WUB32218.1 NACHT domain-containing protein [Streptomyces sp. NBC_00589]